MNRQDYESVIIVKIFGENVKMNGEGQKPYHVHRQFVPNDLAKRRRQHFSSELLASGQLAKSRDAKFCLFSANNAVESSLCYENVLFLKYVLRDSPHCPKTLSM